MSYAIRRKRDSKMHEISLHQTNQTTKDNRLRFSILLPCGAVACCGNALRSDSPLRIHIRILSSHTHFITTFLSNLPVFSPRSHHFLPPLDLKSRPRVAHMILGALRLAESLAKKKGIIPWHHRLLNHFRYIIVLLPLRFARNHNRISISESTKHLSLLHRFA